MNPLPSLPDQQPEAKVPTLRDGNAPKTVQAPEAEQTTGAEQEPRTDQDIRTEQDYRTEQVPRTEQIPRTEQDRRTEKKRGGHHPGPVKPILDSGDGVNHAPNQDVTVQAASNYEWDQVVEALVGDPMHRVVLDVDHQRRLLVHIAEASEYERIDHLMVQGCVFDNALVEDIVLRALEQKSFLFVDTVLFYRIEYSVSLTLLVEIFRHFTMDDDWLCKAMSVLDIIPDSVNVDKMRQIRAEIGKSKTANPEDMLKLVNALDMRIEQLTKAKRIRDQK